MDTVIIIIVKLIGFTIKVLLDVWFVMIIVKPKKTNEKIDMLYKAHVEDVEKIHHL